MYMENWACLVDILRSIRKIGHIWVGAIPQFLVLSENDTDGCLSGCTVDLPKLWPPMLTCNHDHRAVYLTNLGKAVVQHIVPKKYFDQLGQTIDKDKYWFCETCLSVASGTFEGHCSTDRLHKGIIHSEILSAATEQSPDDPESGTAIDNRTLTGMA